MVRTKQNSGSLLPAFLTQRVIQRMAWEHNNRYRFSEDFAETQRQGCERHGMRFVKAQEAALADVTGGIFRGRDEWSDVERAFVSRLVLAVLDAKGPPPQV